MNADQRFRQLGHRDTGCWIPGVPFRCADCGRTGGRDPGTDQLTGPAFAAACPGRLDAPPSTSATGSGDLWNTPASATLDAALDWDQPVRLNAEQRAALDRQIVTLSRPFAGPGKTG